MSDFAAHEPMAPSRSREAEGGMKVMLTLDGKNFSGEVEEVPRMYDIANDCHRAVTQADVQRWLEMEATFTKILMGIREYNERAINCAGKGRLG